MGRGSYTASDWAKLRQSRNIGNAANEKEIFKSRSCNPKFDPKYIQTREARDSEDHPESLPIIIGLDVTGSMGYLAKVVAQEALNETMMKLYSTDAVKDPALMFAAYGDHDDESPLQVTQFESDIRVAEQLLELWLEDCGQGGVALSLLWHFAAKHTALDSIQKRNKKGYLFTIGDSAGCRTDSSDVKRTTLRVIGDQIDCPVKTILEQAQEKFEVFHLFLNEEGLRAHSITKLLPGHTMCIKPGEIDAIPEILISTIQICEGKSKEECLAQWPELKRPIVEKALRDLNIATPKKGLVF